MDETTKLQSAAVHLAGRDAGEAPAGCQRTVCGVLLGAQSPRVVRPALYRAADALKEALAGVTCAGCIVGSPS